MRPRIRTVKPELFLDEKLWDLGQQTGFPIVQAFEGLWCFADREGRFEWRPRALKSGILPYWLGDFDQLMLELERAGFIVRYAVDGREYGLVTNLSRHQRFDHREPASVLPAPPAADELPPVATCPTPPGYTEEKPGCTRVEGKGIGRERKGTEGREGAPALGPSKREQQPAPEQTFDKLPADWQPSAALRADATMAGVSPETLDEDVSYWRGRKLGGDWHDLDAFFRGHFPRLKQHQAKARALTPKNGPNQPNAGLTGLEIFERKAS